jgi:hypothetical protein
MTTSATNLPKCWRGPTPPNLAGYRPHGPSIARIGHQLNKDYPDAIATFRETGNHRSIFTKAGVAVT